MPPARCANGLARPPDARMNRPIAITGAVTDMNLRSLLGFTKVVKRNVEMLWRETIIPRTAPVAPTKGIRHSGGAAFI